MYDVMIFRLYVGDKAKLCLEDRHRASGEQTISTQNYGRHFVDAETPPGNAPNITVILKAKVWSLSLVVFYSVTKQLTTENLDLKLAGLLACSLLHGKILEGMYSIRHAQEAEEECRIIHTANSTVSY